MQDTASDQSNEISGGSLKLFCSFKAYFVSDGNLLQIHLEAYYVLRLKSQSLFTELVLS